MSDRLGLKAAAEEHRERLLPIRVVALDVDGVLTDGRVTWSGEHWTRSFHVHDGFGIKMLARLGFEVAVISADDNPAMVERIRRLGIQHAWIGSEDKRSAWLALREATSAADHEMLCMADELFDLPLLQRAGFSASVPDATGRVLDAVHYITSRPGGAGAVREVIDLLLLAQGRELDIPGFDS